MSIHTGCDAMIMTLEGERDELRQALAAAQQAQRDAELRIDVLKTMTETLARDATKQQDRAIAAETELQRAREALWADFLDARIGDRSPCPKCRGLGVRAYGSTATWRGGIGGQAITSDVCDSCWGSGCADRPWYSWRKVEAMQAALEATQPRDEAKTD